MGDPTMFMRSTKAVLLAVAVLAAVLAPAAAASAQKVAVHDSTADVWESVWNPDSGASGEVRAGSQPNIDIVSTVIRHTGHRLILTLRFADLQRSKTHFFVVSRLRFDKGHRMVAMVDATRRWRGISAVGGLRANKPAKCRNVGHTIDYASNTIVLSIPRSCIGNPRWVELSTVVEGFKQEGATEDDFHSYLDNAQTAGHGYGGWSRRIHQG